MRVERCFSFIDLSGFTSFTERYGDERTVAVLATFRSKVRDIAARRGVRVTKWLGDGAMLSSSDTPAVVSMVLELAAKVPSDVPLEIRAGLAQGPVIMFEGDDYIGRAANVASRLCDAAAPGEVLATREVASLAPRWVTPGEMRLYDAPGFDRPLDACLLQIGTDDVMTADPSCGLMLPAVPGLDTRFGPDNSVIRFCSTACALWWEHSQHDGETLLQAN